jgi:hypothetical protein
MCGDVGEGKKSGGGADEVVEVLRGVQIGRERSLPRWPVADLEVNCENALALLKELSEVPRSFMLWQTWDTAL